MTDEEIVEAMAKGGLIAATKLNPDFLSWEELDAHMVETLISTHSAALSIAKPLIAREARERALQHAMIAVQGVINGSGPNCGTEPHMSLYRAKAAILALSNNPEVGGTPCSP